MMDLTQRFTPLEESVSFYTRNDFAIINNLLLGSWEQVWRMALAAYGDNRGILAEYASGLRQMDGDYHVKWCNALRSRLIDTLDDAAKRKVVDLAMTDISNLLGAMSPAPAELRLYRSAWVDPRRTAEGTFPFSDQYPSLTLEEGAPLEVNIITSCSLTPYRETDDLGTDLYRYELRVPQGFPLLALDQFPTHNEPGEVLLPPMTCRVDSIRPGREGFRQGIISLTCTAPRSVDFIPPEVLP